MTGRRSGGRSGGRLGGRKRTVGYRRAYRKDKARDEKRYAYKTPEYYQGQGYSREESQHLAHTSRHAYRRH